MTRLRNYTPLLRAEWKWRFPDRCNHEHKEFSDEILVAVAFIMRQLDSTGHAPIKLPTGYAIGITPGPTVKGKRGRK